MTSFFSHPQQKVVKIWAVFAFLLFAATITPYLPAPGINTPSPIQSYLNGIFPSTTPGGGSGNWDVEVVYPNLTFTDPVSMLELPDQSGFYIAGKPGFIWKISNDNNTSQKTTVLNFSDVVDTDGDSGMMNAVLHPEFGQAGSPNRGYMYVLYRYHPNGNLPGCGDDAMIRLSRFNKPDGSDNFDRNSEYVHIQLFDTHCWHNGGGMFFDENGFMFVTIGDAGGANDQFNTAQQIDQSLLGGLLKIDLSQNSARSHPIRRQPVDPPSKPSSLPNSFTQGYYIPNDNPWLDTNGGILEEFYSLGLRSPHRATYDPPTGQIWIGDVGQGSREEISVAVKGGNFQWPYREGSINGPKAKPNPLIGVDRAPIFDYNHSVGNSVIGGFVYRGSKFASSLGGKYIFGDHGVRNVWTLNPNNGEVVFLVNIPAFGVGSKSGISSFHTDSDGEVYILKLYGTDQDGGKIYRLKQDVAVPDPPQFLSQTGAFSNLSTLTPSSGIIPYTVNTPLWSDGATKKRWIAVPNNGSHNTSSEQITFSENGEWQFPPGTVFIKHFELPINESNPAITARVETRFIIIAEDGGAYGVTYKWNDAGTDAELLTTGDSKTFTITRNNGTQYSQVWEYPSRTDCNTCHNANANFVLGVKTRQLNGNLTYPSGVTDNQLNTWQSLGMFSNGFSASEISGFPKMVPLTANGASLETKVRSYLDANCAHCHRPNGVEGAFDARFSTPLASQNLINSIGISRNTPDGSVIVKPKDPGASELWVRDNSLAGNAMPPLAKSIIDDTYINVLTDWINGLEESACNTTYLSDLNWEGTPTNGWGPVEVDQSNGGTGSNDGSTLTINGVTYAKGIGAHAESDITYNIGGNYDTFKAFIGVDDATCSSGSVQFQVYTDGSLTYQSQVLTQADNAVPISIDVTNVNSVRLVVNDGGSQESNPIACDHADWADAKLEACTSDDCDDLGLFTSTQDIGGVQAEGQACNDNGFYTVSGSGADIWGANDEFRYIYTNQAGDVEIIAKVNSVQNTNAWAKAGPMIRASSASNSAMAIVLQRPDNQVGFQWRVAAGNNATWTGSLVGGTASTKFLRLTREGDLFQAYYSTSTSNGPWTQIGGAVNISMNTNALVGLAVTSHNDGEICQVNFEEVRLETCTLTPGTSCNDNDPCTINDVYDTDCNCAGTFQDSDNDGVCDQDDVCPGSDDTLDADNDGTPDGCDTCDGNLTGTSCNDNDPCTINDVYDADCNCAGTFQDSDNDGVCDQDDVCPGSDDTLDADNDGTPDGCDTCDGNLEGTSCNDNDPCTINDVYDADCNCAGTFQDSDNDGVCDQDDVCPGFDDTLDGDNDGTPDGCDTCDGSLTGTSCNDNDPCTVNDIYDANCNCAGTFQDSDNDGVCDQDDVCPGSDDTLDADNDGTPDGCDTCDGNLAGTSCNDNDPCTINDVYDADCNCAGTFQDSDNDGVCDQDDVCPGFNDSFDTDGDGTPDGCDTCDGNLTGTSCNDNDPCTVNDVYDANCNCAGTFQDADADGVCAGDDPNDNDPCIPTANGDECNPCSVIDLANFDSGWGIWNDGGSDCTRSTVNPASGTHSARIRDNSGVSSSFYSDPLNLVNYSSIDISFTYITHSMDNTREDFWLQVSLDGGSTYSTYEEWNLGDEFENGVRYYETVSFENIVFTSSTRFRFMCDASTNGDLVYIDDVEIRGCTGTPTCNPGASCDDGLACTTNDVYDADCNCAGTFQDTDADGVCDQDDICPGSDDNLDGDNDGTPDGCDTCDGSLTGTSCNDNDPCTINDVYDEDCNCQGILQDTDADGVCDLDDQCPGFNDNLIGTACDDGDFCTINDIYTADCGCEGTYQDNDNDGLCVGEDPDDNDPCNPNDSADICGDTGDCIVVDEEDFESNWGIWNDGGSDCRRSRNDNAFANSGEYCVRLRDNSGIYSSMYTDPLDFSNFASAEFSLSYYPVSMDKINEDFWLQISTDNGVTYTTYEEWNLGDEFENNQRYNETVQITGVTFSNQTRFRIICDASSNGDYVYIDDVTIKGCPAVQALVKDESADQIAPIQVEPVQVDKGYIEQAIGLNVEVRPNPFTDELRLYIERPSASMKRATMRIMDVSGRIIYQRFDTPFDEEFVINAHQGWTPGIYFIHIQASHLTKTVRVVKK